MTSGVQPVLTGLLAGRPHLPRGEVQVHLLDLDRAEADLSEARPLSHRDRTGPDAPDAATAALGILDAAERDRAARFLNPEARRRFVRSRADLRGLLGGYLGLDPASVPIRLGPAGKPLLGPTGSRGEIGFNLSHAGRYALFAFVREHQVGIDLEAVQASHASPELNGVAARVFAAQEQRALALLPGDEVRPAFFRLWTRREAVLKALGYGLSAPPNDLWVSASARESGWLLGTRHPAPPTPTWLTNDLVIDPGYCAALAVPGGAGFRVRLVSPARPRGER